MNQPSITLSKEKQAWRQRALSQKVLEGRKVVQRPLGIHCPPAPSKHPESAQDGKGQKSPLRWPRQVTYTLEFWLLPYRAERISSTKPWLSRACHRQKPNILPFTKGCSQLEPQLNMKGTHQTTSSRLWTPTSSLCLCVITELEHSWVWTWQMALGIQTLPLTL